MGISHGISAGEQTTLLLSHPIPFNHLLHLRNQFNVSRQWLILLPLFSVFESESKIEALDIRNRRQRIAHSAIEEHLCSPLVGDLHQLIDHLDEILDDRRRSDQPLKLFRVALPNDVCVIIDPKLDILGMFEVEVRIEKNFLESSKYVWFEQASFYLGTIVHNGTIDFPTETQQGIVPPYALMRGPELQILWVVAQAKDISRLDDEDCFGMEHGYSLRVYLPVGSQNSRVLPVCLVVFCGKWVRFCCSDVLSTPSFHIIVGIGIGLVCIVFAWIVEVHVHIYLFVIGKVVFECIARCD